ncbi:Eco57I restriction-modification methylase domain-containing protein [Ruegeria sp.]|uniref:Eco57I restriction-modification methylase domain-containing protein n=1 Tax=Ruegeria sp. TaxID=1879320 RepID=UPI003AFFEFEB
MNDHLGQGGLFTQGFLTDTIREMEDWNSLPEAEVDRLGSAIRETVTSFLAAQSPNEAQTEQDLIWPVLTHLGWTDTLPQQTLSVKGRADVPDGLLFGSPDAKVDAVALPEQWRRYGLGRALLEAKRWDCPLDQRGDAPGDAIPPSTQMLRYMRRAESVTEGKLRWGILTNGRHWRLYFANARSVSEDFLELDLLAVLGLEEGIANQLALEPDSQRHRLKVFILAFRRAAFDAAGPTGRSFHLRAIDEGRSYEARIAEDLSEKVFHEVFPGLARAIAEAAPPGTSLDAVREGALVVLYRILFLLYAEDRNLLPVGDPRYERYSLRHMRRDIGTELDQGRTYSHAVTAFWARLEGLFHCIGDGDPGLGLPPYNGGLFERGKPLVLDGLRLSDAAVASVIDALSFEHTSGERRYINYRDLSVQQLGSVYERILEYDVVKKEDRITIRPNPWARKVSGSYYTPDDLVRCALVETVEPLLERCREAFQDRITAPDANTAPDELAILDPASRMLDLRVCDPAMGSGHFLVALVDYMADRVIAAMAEASRDAAEVQEDYVSPLAARIADIRATILSNAEAHGWAVEAARLDDRHIVRRMVLKRCVHGADKNPMAVELAKVSLWLHTFTVGAPLSFLDHHLRCGDSLFGTWVGTSRDSANLFLHGPVQDALESAVPMQAIELLTDAEIAEAHRSAALFSEVAEMIRPLDAFLSLSHAFDWLALDKSKKPAIDAYMDGLYGDPVGIAQGAETIAPPPNGNGGRQQQVFEIFQVVLEEAQNLAREERFINWQVSFPGVWTAWEQPGLTGGFDAVIGNPPWDRMKLQQVEWFAERDPAIASESRAATRRELIEGLDGSSLAKSFKDAAERSEAALRQSRVGGDYPLLSGGDVNLL